MSNSGKVLVTREWLDWYGNQRYRAGIIDEGLRRLHEEQETERQERERQQVPPGKPRRFRWLALLGL